MRFTGEDICGADVRDGVFFSEEWGIFPSVCGIFCRLGISLLFQLVVCNEKPLCFEVVVSPMKRVGMIAANHSHSVVINYIK